MPSLYFIAVLVGLMLLLWSADFFVNASVATARSLGMAPMLIGLTIVAFGTSAPEMLVSGTAALSGSPSLGIGNALGSNIANIGLVLGITAIISPIPIPHLVRRRELPVLLTMTAAATALFFDRNLDRADGTLLLLLLLTALIVLARKAPAAPEVLHEVAEVPPMPIGKSLALVALGLVALVLSSRILVWGAVGVARWLDISDLIIGLTVVAIGTSLPELAASVASARKGHHDIALGNVIGSNLFNLLGVTAVAVLIQPLELEAAAFERDYVSMLIFTVALAAFVYIMHRKGRLSRWEGGLFTIGYGLYSYALYLDVSGRSFGL